MDTPDATERLWTLQAENERLRARVAELEQQIRAGNEMLERIEREAYLKNDALERERDEARAQLAWFGEWALTHPHPKIEKMLEAFMDRFVEIEAPAPERGGRGEE